jgi:hypothetical protein
MTLLKNIEFPESGSLLQEMASISLSKLKKNFFLISAQMRYVGEVLCVNRLSILKKRSKIPQ